MAETKTVRCGDQTHYIFGDISDFYVLTPIPNAFNGKIGWWLSKKDHTLSTYCFSTMPRDTKEAEYQMKHIDGHIRAYETALRKMQGRDNKMGHWMLAWVDDDELMTPIDTGWRCSECGHTVSLEDKHLTECPRCGIQMDPNQFNDGKKV